MGRLLLAFVLSLSFAAAPAWAQSSFNSTTASYANETISNAAYYIETVNESSYLVFYPNLTQAYADLFKAESIYNTSPAVAVVYANKAIKEASDEYARISSYRNESAIAMAAITIILAALIGRLAMPVRKQRRL
jgi:hypothetical protein